MSAAASVEVWGIEPVSHLRHILDHGNHVCKIQRVPAMAWKGPIHSSIDRGKQVPLHKLLVGARALVGYCAATLILLCGNCHCGVGRVLGSR